MNILRIRNELRNGKSIFDIPLRVTFYARVSTDKEEQLNSLENQVQYFTEFIRSRPNWTYVEGYVDEGISGASTKKRDNFLRMDHTLTEADVPKVEAGKILIFREKRFQSTKTLRGDQIQILGETFTVQQNGYCKNRSNGGAISFMDGVYYIVVDHMQTLQKLQKLAIAEANTENVSAYAYENVLGINITGTETEKIACSGNVENYSSGEKYGVVWRRVRGRAVNRKELLALYGGFFFLGIFLGTVFLAVTVMIIFYKQVSEGYEDKERYRIMEQVGMSNVEVKSAIETQIRMVFFLPIVVAVLHVVAAFPLIRRVLSLLIMDSGQLFVWCLVTTVLAFAVIYYVVFRITSKIYYRIVGNQVR